jgi:hypothetical protein
MREFDIYLPSTFPDGKPIGSARIQKIKQTLVDAFGGYTHFPQKSQGAWKMGGVTFHDEVTVIRLLDDGSAHFDMQQFKKSLEVDLQQEAVLIVSREVTSV